MVRETGPASRMAMYNDGIRAFAALVAEKPNGNVYSLGRRSVWVPFDLGRLYQRLNEIESNIVNDNNQWGGSDTIGGSPRQTGSQLSPRELETKINDIISRN